MKVQKPSLPKGTRDFNAEQVSKRNFIREAIVETYELFGFQPIETPCMEKLSTLTGKYGDEGDQLLFKILNQGEFLNKADQAALDNKDSKALASSIAEKGLRYDLTVPFARFVVMNQSELPMPFRRYQIQPVWRGDRPQKGRYREFWQCDADVIGTNSLINELEFCQIFDRVFGKLGINAIVKINNRKILNGMAELIGAPEKFNSICVAIDKLDKIQEEGVRKELKEKVQLEQNQIDTLIQLLQLKGSNSQKIDQIAQAFGEKIAAEGVAEVRELLSYLEKVEIKNVEISFDPTIARGLAYYTGTIYEVFDREVKVGAISAGGRYDDLTGIFGLDGMSGVGISFGMDRIYDVLEERGWPDGFSTPRSQVVFINFDAEGVSRSLECLQYLRAQGISAEIYPDTAGKMGKKFKYADRKKIPFAAILGSDELETGKISLKNLQSGEQQQLTLEELAAKLA